MNVSELRTRIASVTVALLTVAAVSQVARGEVVGLFEPPTFTISVEGFGPTWTYSPALDVLENLPGNGRKLGVATAIEHILGNRASVVIDKLEFDPDPFVLNNVLLTNTTTTTQIYTVGLALPTTFAAPNEISGTVRTDVIDGGGDPGATVATTASFPIYAAQIDYANVATLQNAPFSVVAAPASSASSSASFGPTPSAVAVTDNINIELRFSLTPGDTASILSRFDVVASDIIPEPSTPVIAAVGIVLGLLAARRRTASVCR